MAVEGFLGRWSRRKREAERESAPEGARDRVDEAVRDAAQERAERKAELPPPVTALDAALDAPLARDGRAAAPDLGPGPQHADDATVQVGTDPHGGTDAAPGQAAQGDPSAQSSRRMAAAQARAPSIADALPDIATLTGDSDFSPFMRAGVDPKLRVAALKKLFADPRFNRMDGLDVYIDDYGKPDPLPPGMLRRLEQGRSLGLFRDEEEEAKVAAAEPGAAGDVPSRSDTTDGTQPVASEDDVDEAAEDMAVAASGAAADGGASGGSADGDQLRAAGDGILESEGSVDGGGMEQGGGLAQGEGTTGIERTVSGEPDRGAHA